MSLISNSEELKHLIPDNNPNNYVLENKNGEITSKIAHIFYLQLSKLNETLNSMCNGNFRAVGIPNDNAISQHRLFFDNCMSEIIKYFVLKSPEIQIHKITNDKPIIYLKEFKKWCKKSLENVLELATKEFGVTVLSHSFQIDSSDIEKHRLNKKVYKSKALSFDCVRYAFYKLGESNVEGWLFGKTDQDPFATKYVLPVLINELDYFIVNEPQENDLIIYINALQKPIHFGVMSDSHTVHSKWGLLPQIFSHPIHTNPYGNSFIILRKKKS